MRFFTRAWQHGDDRDSAADDPTAAYAAYLRSVAGRLPEHILAFATPTRRHLAVDDAKVDRAEIDAPNRRISLRLLNGDVQTGYGKLDLVFAEARLLEPSPRLAEAILTDPRTEFLVHEVERMTDGSLEVRFLLWPDGELAIGCRDVRATWKAIEDTSRTDVLRQVIGFE